MAIQSENAAIAGFLSPQTVQKAAGIGKGAGSWHSLWTIAGQPGGGAAAGSVNGAIPTDATAGAFPFTNPTSPALSYLAVLGLTSQVDTSLTMYDRLWHNSALSATVTTSQAITQPALTRWTTGDGVQIWVEIYTATTATATVTITYTNQAGTTGKTTTVVIPAATVAGQAVPVQSLAAGDTGVRAVTAVQLSATMTAGNWGLTLAKPLASGLGLRANVGQVWGLYDLGMPPIADDASIAFMASLTGTVTPALQGQFSMTQG